MATYDNTYSRVVAWLKVLLPVIALVLLSTMFLISRTIDPSRAIPFANVDVEGMVRDQRISAPSFSGVTEDGAALSITAETARPLPDNADGMSAEALTARIETPDGAQVDIEAAEALVDGATSLLTLSGGVVVTTSTDYRIEAAGLITKMDRAEMESDGAVQATGPLGTLDAGQARIAPADGDASTYLLVFKDGVKLVYVPKGPGDR
ncbi:LPS export ABC transporter periplasmic protein LptC [Aliiroseovarius sp.]|uniref:LPS export ABC transporter periplasmic protein LptC n=1 Tax=Aliiroseovarius sp. TaxID=1872442 RepID=UPI003BAB94B7